MQNMVRISLCAVALAAAASPAPARALTIEFDYSYDTSGFFADPARRELLSLAAGYYSSFADALTTISPGGGDAWTVYFNHPGDLGMGLVAEQNLSIAANTISIFVGGSAMGDGVLGFSTIGTITDLAGSQDFLDAVTTRGQPNATGPEATDYGVWGGAISFNSDASWYFGASDDGLGADASDFLTTAMHELGHILGYGVADSWFHYLDGSFFTGASSMSAYGGPVPASAAHWAEGVTSYVDGREQETLMDPTTAAGIRELPTLLDYAGLYDIGWRTAVPLPAGAPLLASALAAAALLRGRRIRTAKAAPVRIHDGRRDDGGRLTAKGRNE
jgi:hypothetical protein